MLPSLRCVKTYLLYIDGSGNPSLKDDTDQYYALGGVAIKDSMCKLIEERFAIVNYFPDPSNRPNEINLTSMQKGKWWKQQSDDIKERIINDSVSLIAESKAVLFAVVIDKLRHKAKYPRPDDPCIVALLFLLSRFSKFLNKVNELGIVIYDKDRELEIFKETRKWREDGVVYTSYINPFLTNKIPDKIIETIFFIDSKYSSAMWLADFWARANFLKEKFTDYPLYERYKPYVDHDGADYYGRYVHPVK